jgi:uncharacterized membrane protein (DUF106 family)
MINFFKEIYKKYKEKQNKKKLEKIYKERLEELRKRDPFIYKH